VLKTAKGADQ
jgi:hypothetical protein